mmetsp:Transcript_99790/g.277875  ORF Transcript_99790/g.277875 Transcript_99790/m.277875 type:complete len:274 (+) Transcript_99790:214-1035(+)
MGKAGAANAAKCVPIDHLLEAGSWGITLLVKECGLDRRPEQEAANRHDADESTAGKQAHGGSLGSVAQGAKRHERADDEVAVCHADLEAALPGLQPVAVEGQVVDKLRREQAVGDRCLHLVAREHLRAPPLDHGPRVPNACWSWDPHWNLAGADLLEETVLSVQLLRRLYVISVRRVDSHVPEISPAHLRGLARAVGLRVNLQDVQVGFLRRVLPILLRHGGQQLVKGLLIHDGPRNVLEVRHRLGLGLLCDLDVRARRPGGAAAATGACSAD